MAWNDMTSIRIYSERFRILIFRHPTEEEFNNTHRWNILHDTDNLLIEEYLIYPHDRKPGVIGGQWNMILIDEHLNNPDIFHLLTKGTFANCPPHIVTIYNTYQPEEFSDS